MKTALHSRAAALAGGLRRLLDGTQPCPACGTKPGSPLCARCCDRSGIASEMGLAETGNLPLHFVGAYHGSGDEDRLSPLGTSLVAFKDRGDRYAGRCLARLFAEHCARHAACMDAVVPVPPEPRRLIHRGYAPASWLAAALSRRCGSPLVTRLLTRTTGHTAQRGLGGAARRANAQGAFSLGGAGVQGYSVVLVDDVITSGATLREAACCLEEAGVVVAFAAVLACADERILRECRSRTARDGKRSTGAAAP